MHGIDDLEYAALRARNDRRKDHTALVRKQRMKREKRRRSHHQEQQYQVHVLHLMISTDVEAGVLLDST